MYTAVNCRLEQEDLRVNEGEECFILYGGCATVKSVIYTAVNDTEISGDRY